MNVQINDLNLIDFSVRMSTSRKLDRVEVMGMEGDNMVNRGRSSFEFELMGKMTMEDYGALITMIEKGHMTFKGPFGEHVVLPKRITYQDDGVLYMKLVEDVDPSD